LPRQFDVPAENTALVLNFRGAQIFQKYIKHLKIIDVRRVT
jgi:hypothetical protein